MTSENIRIDAQLLCGFQINSITAFTWVKDAINYIARNYYRSAPVKTINVSIQNAPEYYQLSDELVKLEKINKHGERRSVEQHIYDCTETGNIKFWKNGSYDITYRYVPASPQTIESNILIPDRYAEIIKYYVAARQRWRVFGQNDQEAQSFDGLFWSHLSTADTSFSNVNRRNKRMPARF